MFEGAYSYNCFNGQHNHDDPVVENHVLAAQSLIVTDLICKYLIGVVPQKDNSFKLLPLALEKSKIKSFIFGPYQFCGKELVVKYRSGKHEVFFGATGVKNRE